MSSGNYVEFFVFLRNHLAENTINSTSLTTPYYNYFLDSCWLPVRYIMIVIITGHVCHLNF